MSSRFTRAVVQGLRNREMAPVITEVVALVAQRHGDDAARLFHKLLLRHARRSGRKRRSRDYLERLKQAVVYARFNKGPGQSKARSFAAIELAAKQYGLEERAVRRAFEGRDPDIKVTPEIFRSDFPREPEPEA